METLRKGSKGAAVVTLQKALGITADGDFGKNTENAVKKFQTEKGLWADGVVGAKTWAALGIGSAVETATNKVNSKVNSKAVADFVVYDPLSVHISKGSRIIRYIAIHYTAGGSSEAGSAKAVKNVFIKRSASADFCVDDRDVVQFNPDLPNYYCWSVGDKKNYTTGGAKLYGIASNRNTVSIEICSNLTKGYDASKANHSGWYFTDEAINNALKLVRALMKKYNVPKERIVRHYDVSGKLCPGMVGWNKYPITDAKGNKYDNNEKAWEAFLAKI